MQKLVGSNANLSNLKELQDVHNKGKKSFGQLIPMPSGRNEIRIPITGTARALLGFNISYCPKDLHGNNVDFSPATQVSVTLNNDIIINNVALILLSPDNNQSNEFYKYVRPLTGSDQLILTTTNAANESFYIVFCYYFVDKV